MYNIIIGNIVAFIAASISIFVGIIKNRKNIIFTQIIQSLLFSVSNFILGGYTATIINLMNIIRNILCYKENLSYMAIFLMSWFSIILTIKFNNLGLIGLLPLITNITYTIFMNMKDILKFKILILLTMIPWFVHDIVIKSYTSSILYLITIIMCFISIYQIMKKENKNDFK